MTTIQELLGILTDANRQAPTPADFDKAVAAKFETLTRLWRGDDDDAKLVLELVGPLRAIANTLWAGGTPLSALVLKSFNPLTDALMDVVDELTHLGVVRSRALHLPIPGTPEWEGRTAQPPGIGL